MSRPTKREMEARIASMPEPDLSDPDNPEWTEADFRRARPPEILAAFPRTVARLRGPQRAPTKKQVTLRLDREVLSHFQSEGPGWQSRINAALRRVIGKAS